MKERENRKKDEDLCRDKKLQRKTEEEICPFVMILEILVF
jgi:hypothetical protein